MLLTIAMLQSDYNYKGRTVFLFIFVLLFIILAISSQNKPTIYEIANYSGHYKTDRQRETKIDVKLKSQKDGWKKILLWTPYFRSIKQWKMIFRRHFDNECKESRCTFYTSKKNVNQADALLFSSYDLSEKNFSLIMEPSGSPQNRTQEQIYVFFSMEPPPTLMSIDFKRYDNFFNWTMTYRRDSDVYSPFGKFYKLVDKKSITKFRPSTDKELNDKQFAIWMVSHCGAFSRRDEFVKKLQSYVPVHQFGSCGILRCGERYILPFIKPGVPDPCDKITKSFIFFLALENALCKDYVSEKMYRALQMGVIPVVMGGLNYTSFAPPNSYIDVSDFDSVEDLAKYMIEVSKDTKLYNSYFKWKEEYEIEIGDPLKPFVCGLCEKLHAANVVRESRTLKSIDKWFIKDAECHFWKDNDKLKKEKSV